MMFEEKIAKLNSQQDRKKSHSVPEIQKILKVERHTVYKLIKEGHFKAAFIGGKWRISRLSFGFMARRKGVNIWLRLLREKTVTALYIAILTKKANHTSAGNNYRLMQKRGNEKIKLSTNRTTMFLPFPKQERSENCL